MLPAEYFGRHLILSESIRSLSVYRISKKIAIESSFLLDETRQCANGYPNFRAGFYIYGNPWMRHKRKAILQINVKMRKKEIGNKNQPRANVRGCFCFGTVRQNSVGESIVFARRNVL